MSENAGDNLAGDTDNELAMSEGNFEYDESISLVKDQDLEGQGVEPVCG